MTRLLNDPTARRDLFVAIAEIEARLNALEGGGDDFYARFESGSLVFNDSNGDAVVEVGLFDDGGTTKVGIRVTDPSGPTVLLDHSVNY
jgi:hypothetical protein